MDVGKLTAAVKLVGVTAFTSALLFPLVTAEHTAAPAPDDEPPAATGPVDSQLGQPADPITTPTPSPEPSEWGLDFPTNPTFQQTEVSQHGITWRFDRAHTVGQYVNGDWWVVGPVVLSGITPASTSDRNGENINPGRGDVGYDSGLSGPFERLSFPATVPPGSSVVKGVSRTSPPDDSHRGKLQTAAVLTVVDAPPPKNGAIAFRPPYFEADKPQYLTTDLRTDLLPTLAPPSGVDIAPLSRVAAVFERLQLDHDTGNESNRWLHPVENLRDYGAKVAQDTNFAALRLMFDDPLSDKSPALINYVQYGIDLSAMVKHDSYVCAGVGQSCAGHGPGRTLPLVFAATLLESPEMRQILADGADGLPENDAVNRTPHAPTPLFGDAICSEEQYEEVRDGGSGPKTCRDPHGYIDGGQAPGSYLRCCMSQPWKGSVVAMHLMPELASTWPQSDVLIEFIDRYVTFGLWTRPDPHDRFASAHGTHADDGHYRTDLADALWEQHNLADRVTTEWTNHG